MYKINHSSNYMGRNILFGFVLIVFGESFIILLLLSDEPMCSNQFLADLHDNYEAITKHGIYAKPPTGTILPHSPGRTYVNYQLQYTTLQSIMNAKLSKRWFWHCHENALIKTVQTIPHNL